MQIRLAAGCLVATLLLGGNSLPAAPSREVEVGQVLRDAPLRGLNGPDRRLAAYRGRPLLINVWASWCEPCRDEMASLERLAWRDHPVPFAVIGISTDDDAQAARIFLQNTHATLSQYIDRQRELETLLGAKRLPLTLLVDARGRVLRKVYGARQWDAPPALQSIHAAFSATVRSSKP